MRPKRVDGLGHQPLDVLQLGHVGDDAEDADALLPYLRLGLAQPLLAAGAEGDVAALVGEGEGDGPPDAAAGAGDDGDLVLQSEVHSSLQGFCEEYITAADSGAGQVTKSSTEEAARGRAVCGQH